MHSSEASVTVSAGEYAALCAFGKYQLIEFCLKPYMSRLRQLSGFAGNAERNRMVAPSRSSMSSRWQTVGAIPAMLRR
jgi:hypothetical protein